MQEFLSTTVLLERLDIQQNPQNSTGCRGHFRDCDLRCGAWSGHHACLRQLSFPRLGSCLKALSHQRSWLDRLITKMHKATVGQTSTCRSMSIYHRITLANTATRCKYFCLKPHLRFHESYLQTSNAHGGQKLHSTQFYREQLGVTLSPDPSYYVESKPTPGFRQGLGTVITFGKSGNFIKN